MSNVYVVLSTYPEFRARRHLFPIADSLLRIATNEIASFCIDHRSRQMAVFLVKGGAEAGQKAGFRVMLKFFETKMAFRYYIKQINSMLPCV